MTKLTKNTIYRLKKNRKLKKLLIKLKKKRVSMKLKKKNQKNF